MKKIALTLLAISTTGLAHADLTVVQDFGGAALATYINMNMLPERADLEAAIAQAQASLQNQSINTDSLMLPQPQTEFTPGAVVKHQLAMKLPMPFYLIGTDEQSVNWATQNAAYLKSIHAQGMIIGATSTDQIKTVEDQTGLSFMPGNVAGLSSIVGTNHYPFLVYQGWVSQ